MKPKLPTKRRTFPDLNGFRQRHPGFIFDESTFLASLELEDELEQELQNFIKNFSKFPHPPNFKKHWKFFQKHPIYSNKPDRPITKSHLRDASNFESTVAPGGRQWSRFTSGTSGKPVEVVLSSREHFTDFFQCVLRSLLRRGINHVNHREVFSVFVTDNSRRNDGVFIDPTRRTGLHACFVVRSSSPEDALRLHKWIEQERPEVLTSKPHLLDKILKNWQQLGLKPPTDIQAVVTSGSTLSTDLRETIETYLQAPAVNSLNTTELGHIAAECPEQIFHVDLSHVHLDQDEQGDLLGTLVGNECMPLWKYTTGDQGRLESRLCKCGSEGLLITEFTGRKLTSFQLSDGRKLAPSAWMNIFRDIPQLEEYQVTQISQSRYDVLFETSTLENDEVLEQLRQYLLKDLPADTQISLRHQRFEKNQKFSRFRSEAS